MIDSRKIKPIVNYDKDEILDEIMKEYGNDVLHLAFSYVKNRSTAEDLAQEAFIKCYAHLDDFKWNSSLKTWLYRITINTCKDYLKSWSFRKVSVNSMIETLVKGQEKTPEYILIKNDEKSIISRKVMSLPLKYREVILLYYYEELKLKEISNLLEINLSTVKSRIKRAKLMLEDSFTGGKD